MGYSKKAFNTIAKTRISQAIGSICTQLGLGWVGLTPLGLILGQIASGGTGLISLTCLAVKDGRSISNKVTRKTLQENLSKYSHHPKYSPPEALMNSAGIQVPIILIASTAIGQEAGFLMLAMRVMQAPMGLIGGGAIGQVYLSRAPEERRGGILANVTSSTISDLLKVGAGPLLFAGLVAPNAFSLAFGEEWCRAGELVSWMTPWLFMQLLASPISIIHACMPQTTRYAIPDYWWTCSPYWHSWYYSIINTRIRIRSLHCCKLHFLCDLFCLIFKSSRARFQHT